MRTLLNIEQFIDYIHEKMIELAAAKTLEDQYLALSSIVGLAEAFKTLATNRMKGKDE